MLVSSFKRVVRNIRFDRKEYLSKPNCLVYHGLYSFSSKDSK